MRTITVVDTSQSTDNLGDEIIMDAVNATVAELFPDAYVFRIPSHEALSDRSHHFLRQSTHCFIGGTNLLASNLNRWGLWRLDRKDTYQFAVPETVLLGTGWNDYQNPPDRATREMLGRALSRRLLHSARDGYTRQHLVSIGLNAINTSCPTTWSLTPEHCAGIPRARAREAVFTLSAWRPDAGADRAFVDTLRRHYQRLWFFPQMQDDWTYFQGFGWSDVRMVPPTTEGYTRFLEQTEVDVVGTRLHGGIRALQRSRRALILAIDNRAAEIGRDTGLPVLPRSDTGGIEAWIEGGAATELHLPTAAIAAWKAQFKSPAPETILAATPVANGP